MGTPSSKPYQSRPFVSTPVVRRLRTTKQWEAIKDDIHQHYIVEKNHLPRTMEWISEKYYLDVPEERTWKTKFESWGFEKKFRPQEFTIVIAKAEKRKREEGKDTTMCFHGAEITEERVSRFKRRNLDVVASPSAATPPGYTYQTPAYDSEMPDADSLGEIDLGLMHDFDDALFSEPPPIDTITDGSWNIHLLQVAETLTSTINRFLLVGNQRPSFVSKTIPLDPRMSEVASTITKGYQDPLEPKTSQSISNLFENRIQLGLHWDDLNFDILGSECSSSARMLTSNEAETIIAIIIERTLKNFNPENELITLLLPNLPELCLRNVSLQALEDTGTRFERSGHPKEAVFAFELLLLLVHSRHEHCTIECIKLACTVSKILLSQGARYTAHIYYEEAIHSYENLQEPIAVDKELEAQRYLFEYQEIERCCCELKKAQFRHMCTILQTFYTSFSSQEVWLRDKTSIRNIIGLHMELQCKSEVHDPSLDLYGGLELEIKEVTQLWKILMLQLNGRHCDNNIQISCLIDIAATYSLHGGYLAAQVLFEMMNSLFKDDMTRSLFIASGLKFHLEYCIHASRIRQESICNEQMSYAFTILCRNKHMELDDATMIQEFQILLRYGATSDSLLEYYFLIMRPTFEFALEYLRESSRLQDHLGKAGEIGERDPTAAGNIPKSPTTKSKKTASSGARSVLSWLSCDESHKYGMTYSVSNCTGISESEFMGP